MSTPTTQQINDMRRDTGDQLSPLLLGYADYARLFSQAAGVYALTIYTALTRMIPLILQRMAGCSTKDERDALSKRLEGIKAMLDYWRQEAGVYGGSIGIGTLSYELDADCDNLQS